MAADLMQKVPQERGGLDALNVVLKEPAVERAMKPPGADGDARYGRDAIVTVTMVNDRRPPDGAPGFAGGRNQEEAGLVDEDDVGCQPRDVFLLPARQFASSGQSPPRSVRARAAPASGDSIPIGAGACPRDYRTRSGTC